jgi:NAD(P)-dependent dehydrogenase (short-subunit alcohol dehydrogenase family)
MNAPNELFDLAGRVAVITGGAGHLGRAMARMLASCGATIALIDRAGSSLEAAAGELPAGRTATYVCDLQHEEARSELAGRVQADLGRTDVLVNNAAFVGDSQLRGWVVPFAEQTIDTWRQALEVNLTAPFHLAQLFHPMLVASGHGVIINIGSIYGLLGPDMSLYEGTSMGNPAAYAASKGGLVQLTRWLATALAPDIRVNCITPGGVERGQPEVFSNRYIARTPLGRMAREDDFAGAVAFLASDASAYVTGQNLVIDGGWSAW